MKNVLVVANYNAGRKQAVMHKKTLQKFLFKRCRKFKFISIEELNHVDFDEFDTVFAIGGDGTVSKIVNFIFEKNAFEKVLGIIPSGTANLLAEKLGFSQNLQKTLKLIDKNNIKKIDAVKINDKYSVLRFGLGYDSEIICKTPQSLKNKFGYFAYFIAGIIFALRLSSKTYKITYDDNTLETDSTCVIIANAPNMYRNFISVGKNSEPDDGLIDVFVLKAKNPVTFFLEFLKITFGIKINSSLALYFQAKNIKIENNWTACHIDGEKTKLKDNISIDIVPQKINVYCR